MLSCLLFGEKPRFLFVHGSSSSVAVWVPVMKAMAALGESCVAVDLRGHGRSSGREHLQSYRIQHYVEDVISVLKEYPSIRTLVGHSMGGLICQLVASRMRIGHLILVASSPVGGMLMDGLRMSLRHPVTMMAVFFRRSFARLYKVPAVARSLLFHPDTADDVVEESLARIQEESWLGGNQLNWLLPKPGRVTCPVSVIGGSHDKMVSPASVSATARAYGVAPVFVEGTAHMVPIEAEPQAFAKLLIKCTENISDHGLR
jgi:pimeloyl-ACP methyl ester carboxylesterase